MAKFIGIFLGVVSIIAIVLAVVTLGLLIAYGAYWITLSAGAPKCVAVIVGIAVFVLGGLSIKLRRK